MISLAEIIRSLYGAYRLARFDDGGLAFFDVSLGGFWRSFFAAVLVAPVFLVLVTARYVTTDIDVDLSRFLILEGLGYVIAWLAFPVIMESLTVSLDRRDRFVQFVVAYNWVMVIQNSVYFPVVLFGIAGWVPEAMTNMLAFVVLFWTFIYTGFVVRSALDVPSVTAAGIVVIDFLLAVVIDLLVTGRM